MKKFYKILSVVCVVVILASVCVLPTSASSEASQPLYGGIEIVELNVGIAGYIPGVGDVDYPKQQGYYFIRTSNNMLNFSVRLAMPNGGNFVANATRYIKFKLKMPQSLLNTYNFMIACNNNKPGNSTYFVREACVVSYVQSIGISSVAEQNWASVGEYPDNVHVLGYQINNARASSVVDVAIYFHDVFDDQPPSEYIFNFYINGFEVINQFAPPNTDKPEDDINGFFDMESGLLEYTTYGRDELNSLFSEDFSVTSIFKGISFVTLLLSNLLVRNFPLSLLLKFSLCLGMFAFIFGIVQLLGRSGKNGGSGKNSGSGKKGGGG